MSISIEDIYASSNGDRWQLVRDTTSGDVIVRHIANPSSGGRITEMSPTAFLNQAGSGPEFQAVRQRLAREP